MSDQHQAETTHLTEDERRRLLMAYRDGVLDPGSAVLLEVDQILASRVRTGGVPARNEHTYWASVCTCGMAEQERTGHYPEHEGWCDVPSPIEDDTEDEPCAQSDHDRVWARGREAGYRDALIALAERGGDRFFDELDREIADALRHDREYIEAHDAAVLTAALRAEAGALPDAVKAQVLRDARDEIQRALEGFPLRGRSTRAWWAVAWLDRTIEQMSFPPEADTR